MRDEQPQMGRRAARLAGVAATTLMLACGERAPRQGPDEEAGSSTLGAGRRAVASGIYEAAVLGDRRTVEAIVSKHPEAVNEADRQGFTPLHGLAEEEHPELALYLIAHGADVNATNDDGVTPLHLAGHPAMARLLLAHGAKLEARTHSGATPLLVLAAEPEREDVIALLLEAGADVNAMQGNGDTALDIAISREESSKVSLLRRHGAKRASELR